MTAYERKEMEGEEKKSNCLTKLFTNGKPNDRCRTRVPEKSRSVAATTSSEAYPLTRLGNNKKNMGRRNEEKTRDNFNCFAGITIGFMNR